MKYHYIKIRETFVHYANYRIISEVFFIKYKKIETKIQYINIYIEIK